MSDQGFVDLVTNALIQRLSKTPEEAKAMATAIANDRATAEEFSNLMGITIEGMQKLKSVPPEVRRDMVPVMQLEVQKLLRGEDSGLDNVKLAERLALIRGALGGSDDRVMQEIDNIKLALQEKAKSEEHQVIAAMFDEVKSDISRLESRMQPPPPPEPSTPLQPQQPPPQAQPTGLIGEFAQRIRNQLDEVEMWKSTVKDLFKIEEKVQTGEIISAEDMRLKLQGMGYEVKGPKTPEEWAKEIASLREDTMKKLEEAKVSIRQNVEKELQTKEKQQEMVATLGLTMLQGLLSFVGGPEGGKSFQALKELVQGAKA